MNLCACGCGLPVGVNRRGEQQRLRRGHHVPAAGERHPRWNGGRKMNNGYVMLLLPDHPRADAKGYVQEHVLIVERALGKHLNAKHQVHHADLRRANNANENLVACEDAAYHLLLHRRLRALLACGDANARLCHLCKGYDRQSDISISRSDRRGYERCYHRSCAAEREERRRVARSQIQEIAS